MVQALSTKRKATQVDPQIKLSKLKYKEKSPSRLKSEDATSSLMYF